MNVSKHFENGILVKFLLNGVPQKITNSSNAPILVPKRSWPLILLPMKLLAKPEDKGLGDIVERTIGPVGGNAYKIWYKATFGKECGCTKRKDNLNLRYPL